MRGLPLALAFGLAPLLLALGCTPAPTPEPPTAPPAPPTGEPAATGEQPGAPEAALPGAAPAGKPCGALDCQLFDDPREALAVVLAEGPQVLAVGEAHAQRGAEVASSTHRFTEQLLPLLADRASDLVIELMIADGKCGEAEKKTSDAQKPVVEKQAENNQNEFVALGNASKARGVQPHVLRPSCDDYQAVAAAGPDGVPRMLEMIARLTDDLVGRILARNAKENRERMVLAYGGAMHNDVAPREGREPWSFGPSLRERTGGHYVELDIFVPEFIKESDTWRAFPWYPHYDRATMGDRTVLFRTGEGAYTLIFPLTKR